MDEAPEFTPAQAADPSTAGEVLAAIAGSRPDLRPYVAANPAAYPGLLDWLSQLGDPAVDGALRARAASQPAPQAPTDAPAAESPYAAPSGDFAAPSAYVPPAAAGGDIFSFPAQGDDAQPPYVAQPEPGAQPYGAQPYGAQPYGPPAGAAYGPPYGGEPPKKSKTWLWVLLGLLGVVIIGGIVIAVLIFNLANRAANDVGDIFNTGDATSYGDSAELDALWDACEGGDMAACDDLYRDSPTGSDYERFGDTCGDRSEGGDWCINRPLDGGAAGLGDQSALSSGESMNYGDDAALDALWDSCEAGDGAACDQLYRDSPAGSEYEQFGDSCGGRTDGGTWCASTE